MRARVEKVDILGWNNSLKSNIKGESVENTKKNINYVVGK